MEGLSERLPKKFGPYVLLKLLGSGAAGVVYLARPTSKKRGVPTPVVVKTMHDQLADVNELVARFRHEAELAVVVSNPHVAKVYDAGMVGQTLYIAMEFVPGCRLSQVLVELQKRKRLLPIREVVRIFLGGLEGLEALHGARDAQGQSLAIVHRDISPKNLMVDRRGEMRLIDLGLGKSKMQDWKTRTGTVMGSPGYMAPEQVRGQAASAESDTYAMGIVLWEMLTATPYLPRGNLSEVLIASASPEFRPPSALRPSVPRALDEVLRVALRVKREDRFRSARAFRTALEEIAAELPGPDQSTIDLPAVASLEQDIEEIRRLLAADVPRTAPVPNEDKTVVFAERPDLTPISEGDLAATEVFQMERGFSFDMADAAPGSLLVDGGPPRDETVTQPGAQPIRRPPREPEPVLTHTWGGATEPTAPPVGGRSARGSRGVPLVLTLLLVVCAGALGMVGGRILLPPTSVEIPTHEIRRVVAEAAPVARPVGAVAATSTLAEARPDESALPEATKRPTRKPRRSRAEKAPVGLEPEPGAKPLQPAPGPAPVPPTKPPPTEPIEELARKLTRKAQTLKEARPDRSGEVDLILGDIALETASGDPDRARRRLQEFSRRLDTLKE